MAKHSGQPARDLFPGHNVGPGKGSKTRTNLGSPEWQRNFDEIDWRTSPFAMAREGHKLVKRYGVPAEPKDISWPPSKS